MIKVYNREDLKDEFKKSKTVLAIFYSSWCPYCIRFVPIFDKEVTGHGFENVIHVLLDDNDNILWDDYAIEAVPTVILFEDGEVCSRLDGRLGVGLKENQLTEWIKKLKSS